MGTVLALEPGVWPFLGRGGDYSLSVGHLMKMLSPCSETSSVDECITVFGMRSVGDGQ